MMVRQLTINRSLIRCANCVEDAAETSWVTCADKPVDFRNLWWIGKDISWILFRWRV